MDNYTVSVTISVKAEDKDEAWAKAEKRLEHGDYDHDSIEIEKE